MLAVAHKNIARAKLGDRVLLDRADGKATQYDDGAFGATVSNSIVHHIPEPEMVFREMWRVTASGGIVFVRDLYRPATDAETDRLVGLYGGSPPSDPALRPSFEHQRTLLRNSLCAGLTVAEVAGMVAPLGVSASAVTMTSDRHWTLAIVKP
jgi:ubiquinone/menaquinone biosynthesis C-methylase UbiE